MVVVLRHRVGDVMQQGRLMAYSTETRGWGVEGEHWLGEETVAGWEMESKAIREKVATARCVQRQIKEGKGAGPLAKGGAQGGRQLQVCNVRRASRG